eukprot:s89_g29.t1
MTFGTWAICLPRWIMRSRTAFAWHLRRSFACDFSTPQTSALSTMAFPLPLSGLSKGGGGTARLSRRRFLKLCRSRVLHISVFALNVLYLGRFPTLEELSRRPTALQSAVLSRLRSLIAVCGSNQEPFAIAPGRSGPQLGADLLQLENFIKGCEELRGNYLEKGVSFKEDSALLPSEEYPQLVPYRTLDASRLRLVGRGEWRMSDFIDSTLWLPFVEPAFLQHGLPVDETCGPCFKFESRSECKKLALLWDVNGLLELFAEPAEGGGFSRVFNCYKSEQQDRQIGDRRLMNMSERSYDGPSRFLPPGPLLCQMSVKRFKEKLVASVTDRRDFYHQAKVTSERARTNLLPFRFSKEELEETLALKEFLEKPVARRAGKREEIGDRLGEEMHQQTADDKEVGLFAGFRSLFQGDHL